MKLRFANRTLERSATDRNRARRNWATAGLADAYMDRIPVLMAIDRIEQLTQFQALRFHALHGYRRAQFAIDLVAGWRLIFQYDEANDEIIIMSVEDYHA